MIYSDKQYSVSADELAKLKQALAAAEGRQSDKPWLKKAESDALRSQIADIEAELAEYDLLKSGQVSFSKSYALEELPRVLVQARIAAGMSQTNLAEKLDMKPQQVQRYEATDYMGASFCEADRSLARARREIVWNLRRREAGWGLCVRLGRCKRYRLGPTSLQGDDQAQMVRCAARRQPRCESERVFPSCGRASIRNGLSPQEDAQRQCPE